MAIPILLPRLGWTMEEGRFVEWLKKDGDAVEMGDLLYAVESDKSVNEVEATDPGILRIAPTAPAPDTVVPVGTLLGYIAEAGEALPAPSAEGIGDEPVAVTEDVPSTTSPIASNQQPAASGQPQTASSQQPIALSPTISPRAKRIAAELNVQWERLKGSGKTGRIVERDVRAAAVQPAVNHQAAAMPAAVSVDASPVARRMAEELGVNLAALATELKGKRIDRADVEAAAARAKTAPAAPKPTPVAAPVAAPVATPVAQASATPSQTASRAKLTPVRRITSERMLNSAQNTAPVTLVSEVDATQLVKLRKQLKAAQAASSTGVVVPSFTDLLAKICAVALQEHPTVNTRFDGDEIVTEAAIHIGIAADTSRGLLVPVVRNVQDKTLRQIAAESAELIGRVREGKAKADELSGSTFTITNLGMYAVDAFTPIINVPECAILGVGRIVPKQVVVGSTKRKLAIREMMTLSLTFDHRLVDGAPAARFFQRVQELIKQPFLWLVN